MFSFVSLAYTLDLSTDSPVALNSSITFSGKLMENGRPADSEKYTVSWEYEGSGRYSDEIEVDYYTPDFNYTTQIPIKDYKPGRYQLNVKVYRYLFWNKMKFFIISHSTSFEVTSLVNGQMGINQNNTVRTVGFVSSKVVVNHTIEIKESDRSLLNNAAYDRVFWFIDCVYVGETDSLTFLRNYTVENEKFEVEALLMASYEPLPIPTTTVPSTTTVK